MLVVFVTALAVRCVVAVAVTIGWGGSLFLDDAAYAQMAKAAAAGRLPDGYLSWLYEHTATLLVPITGLYEVFGPVKLAGQLYVALLGAAAAALTARLALEVVDRRWALAAGLLVALLPSQVMWSSIILKDAAVWAVVSGLALVVAIAARSTGARLALCAPAAIGLLVLLAFLRLHTLEVALIALVLATPFSRREQRLVRVGAAVALLVCLPIFFQMGAAGVQFVKGAREPGLQRALNARGAQSAVVPGTVPANDSPGEQTVAGGGVADQFTYLPKGVSVVAFRPWPWEAARGSTGVELARLEVVLWYPLLLLALVGLGAVWRHRQALAFPLICGAGVLLLYSLTEGNLGTAYRHRGELVWPIALLATLGMQRTVQWWGARSSRAVRRDGVAASGRHAPTRAGESSTAV